VTPGETERNRQTDTQTDAMTPRGSRGQEHDEELQGQNGLISAKTAKPSVQTHTHINTPLILILILEVAPTTLTVTLNSHLDLRAPHDLDSVKIYQHAKYIGHLIQKFRAYTNTHDEKHDQ